MPKELNSIDKKIEKILKDMKLCGGFFDYIIEPDESRILIDYINKLEKENKKCKKLMNTFLDKVDKNKMLLNNPDILDVYLEIKEVSE